MPHRADGQLFSSRYARYTTGNLTSREGRSRGAVSLAAQKTITSDTSLAAALNTRKRFSAAPRSVNDAIGGR